MDETQSLIETLSRLACITKEDAKSLLLKTKTLEFAQGEHLFQTGDKVENAYAVLNGVTRNYYKTKEGAEFIKTFITPGRMVFPYLEYLSGVRSRTSAQAITPTKVLKVNFKSLLEVLNTSSQLKELHLAAIQESFAKKEKREFELLTLDATERYKSFLDEFGEHDEEIPNMYVASYIGITPVSLSRLRKQFK